MRISPTLFVVLAGVALAVAPAHARGSSADSKSRASNHGSFSQSPGSHSVRGYTTKNGTYVAPHHATSPDSNRMNNWSTKGNVNPYNSKAGTIDPYRR